MHTGLELPRKILHSSISIFAAIVYARHPQIESMLKSLGIATTIIVAADLIRFSSKPFARVYNNLLGMFMREEEANQVNGVVYYLGGVIFVVAFLPRGKSFLPLCACIIVFSRETPFSRRVENSYTQPRPEGLTERHNRCSDIACLSIIILSLCDTVASIFGRIFGKYTPRLPLSGTLFGAHKSLAGTLSAAIVGAMASYAFWTRLAPIGDEGDLSVVAARALGGTMAWTGGRQEYAWPRLGGLDSSLEVGTLSVLCGAIAGLSEAIDVYGLDDNLSLPILFGLFLWSTLKFLG